MERPAVLVVDPNIDRRRALSLGLASEGYEVVPAVSTEEGRRFARGLGPAVIVAPTDIEVLDEATAMEHLAGADPGMPRTLVLLGRAPEDAEMRDEIRYLQIEGRSESEIVRRIRLVLIGREIGADPDDRLRSLVGDLLRYPLGELVAALEKALVTARIETRDGTVVLDRGEVRAARAGSVKGVKAYCRLARQKEGYFRVELGPVDVEPNISQSLESLVIASIEDGSHPYPDPKSVLEVRMGPAFFNTSFSGLQQRILGLAHDEATVGGVLDALPETDAEIAAELDALRDLGVVSWDQPEPEVRILTDSTADLSAEMAREHGIEVVPLTVHFGERIYRDRVDLDPASFYEMLEDEAEPHPFTNPVKVGEFARRYLEAAATQDVISIHISSELSLTAEHARFAAEAGRVSTGKMRKREQPPVIEVIDSRQVSLGLGLLAVFAARMAARGEKAERIAERIRSMRERIQTLFVVDTLEFLQKGGRIGKAQALLGTLLRIKPILGLVDGQVAPVDRARGSRAAMPKLIDRLTRGLDPDQHVFVGIAHAKAPVRAERLASLIEKELRVAEVFIAEMGPVVGTHVGTGCVGAVCFQPDPEEAALIAPLGTEAVLGTD